MMEIKKCPRCGFGREDINNFCPICGSSIDGDALKDIKMKISNAIDEIDYNDGITFEFFKDLKRTNPLKYWQIASKLYSDDLGCHKTQLSTDGGELSD